LQLNGRRRFSNEAGKFPLRAGAFRVFAAGVLGLLPMEISARGGWRRESGLKSDFPHRAERCATAQRGREGRSARRRQPFEISESSGHHRKKNRKRAILKSMTITQRKIVRRRNPELCQEKRAAARQKKNSSTWSPGPASLLTYELPLKNRARFLRTALKSVSRDYAWLDYHLDRLPGFWDLIQKLDVSSRAKRSMRWRLTSIATLPPNAVARSSTRLRKLIPRQMFEVPFPGPPSGSRRHPPAETVAAHRKKNVLANLTGGDHLHPQKRKLLEKKRRPKRRMTRVGQVGTSQQDGLPSPS